jgi:hypothetical protein
MGGKQVLLGLSLSYIILSLALMAVSLEPLSFLIKAATYLALPRPEAPGNLVQAAAAPFTN